MNIYIYKWIYILYIHIYNIHIYMCVYIYLYIYKKWKYNKKMNVLHPKTITGIKSNRPEDERLNLRIRWPRRCVLLMPRSQRGGGVVWWWRELLTHATRLALINRRSQRVPLGFPLAAGINVHGKQANAIKQNMTGRSFPHLLPAARPILMHLLVWRWRDSWFKIRLPPPPPASCLPLALHSPPLLDFFFSSKLSRGLSRSLSRYLYLTSSLSLPLSLTLTLSLYLSLSLSLSIPIPYFLSLSTSLSLSMRLFLTAFLMCV